MLILWCQDLDGGAVLVHAAALGPFFGLTDISVDHHQMHTVMIPKEEEDWGGCLVTPVWRLHCSFQNSLMIEKIIVIIIKQSVCIYCIPACFTTGYYETSHTVLLLQ